jgi:hypothetical protein
VGVGRSLGLSLVEGSGVDVVGALVAGLVGALPGAGVPEDETGEEGTGALGVFEGLWWPLSRLLKDVPWRLLVPPV